MKKFIVLFLLFLATLYGCCGEHFSNWSIQDFTIDLRYADNRLLENNEFEGDSLKLLMLLEQDFAYISTLSNPFLKTANALSCEPHGDKGMFDKVLSIAVTSSEAFENHPSGTSLNDIIMVQNHSLYFSIEEWIAHAEDLPAEFNDVLSLVLIKNPAEDSNHIFTIKVTLESGTTITQTSEEVLWH